jgi:amino-acid N-acetyltransferase
MDETASAEIACLAVHPDYQNGECGQTLLDFLTEKAKKLGVMRLFVRTTQTLHWFVERGFIPCELDDLPAAMKQAYNYQRNAKLLVKNVPGEVGR